MEGQIPDSYAELIDDIYEAAAVPEKWTGVLEDVSAVTDAAYASLVTLRGGVLRHTEPPVRSN